VDAILETGGCERFDGEVFSLFERRLRAEIGWYVSVGSSTGVLIWDKDSDGRLSARSGRSWNFPEPDVHLNVVCISCFSTMAICPASIACSLVA